MGVSHAWLSTILAILFLSFFSCKDSDDDLDDIILEEDSYVGEYKLFSFSSETEEIERDRLIAYFKANDGTIFSRQLKHLRTNGNSRFELLQGIKEGTYQLLYFEYTPSDAQGPDDVEIYSMGNFFRVSSEGIVNTSNYDSNLGLFGSGTEEDPYSISCAKSLFQLQRIVNDDDGKRKYLPATPFFRQDANFDLDFVSYLGDNKNGWFPIGKAVGKPFEGVYEGNGFKITGLWANRETTVGVGLFGFIRNSIIQNLTIDGADMDGLVGTAALAGTVISAGNSTDISVIKHCKVIDSSINGAEDGYGTGSIVGAVDSKTILWLDSCEVDGSTEVTGSYAVGGILGAGHTTSFTQLSYCQNNSSSVTGKYTGVGGIVGTADTLLLHACRNSATINGATMRSVEKGAIGTGGIIGGGGTSLVSSSENTGKIDGYIGVGGIIGSTRIATEPQKTYNSAMIQTCINSGAITGEESVGGICGEAQTIGFTLQNEGEVQGKYAVGGILGFLPVGSLINSFNNATVKCQKGEEASSCGGIVGRACLGLLALNQNFGDVEADCLYTGGILGAGGGNLMIHYCLNTGTISNKQKDGYVGGLVGAIGNTKTLGFTNYAHIVIGALNIGLGIIPVVPAIVEKAELVISIGKYAAIGGLWLYETLSSTTELLEVKLNKSGSFSHWCDHLSEQIQTDNQSNYQLINSRSKSLTGSLELGNLDSQLQKEVITTSYANNQNALAVELSSEANDYEKLNAFVGNMNTKLQERAEKIRIREQNKEIVYNIVGGISVAGAAISFVASIVVTGGIASLIIISGALGVVGGINTILGEVIDYETNAVFITQCVNTGNVSGKEAKYAAGLVGKLHDYGIIQHCVNLGSKKKYIVDEDDHTGDNTFAFTYLDSNAEISDCLNCGFNWSGFTNGVNDIPLHCYTSAPVDDIFVDEISYNRLSKKSTFFIWFNEKELWEIPNDTIGNFPIPYKSEMQ